MRKKVQRLRREREERLSKVTIFDQFDFDRSVIEKEHPKLFKVQIHRLSESKIDLYDIDCAKIDSEMVLDMEGAHFAEKNT